MLRLLGMDLRGHLDIMLLATLRDDGPAHGYAIIASLRERSLGAFDLPEGTVYPALYRLERDGLVGSEWDASAASRRRVYSLTPAGARALVGGGGRLSEIERYLDELFDQLAGTGAAGRRALLEAEYHLRAVAADA